MRAILSSDRRNKIIKHYMFTLWARLGSVSQYLARQFASANPPILILSFPRSGSSWVGTILGSASNTMYLREPITQSWLAAGQKRVVTGIDPHHPPKMYKLFANDAFAGIPKFNRIVV